MKLLYEYLLENTCEEHYATIKDMIDYLRNNEIDANRNTIYKDIDFLIENGVDIICDRSIQNRYFIGQRDYEIPEIKMLLDALDSARFAPREKINNVKEKLFKKVSKFEREELKKHVIFMRDNKRINERVLYCIDDIHNAITKKKKISFFYSFYNDLGIEEYKHNGKKYIISPYALKWENDMYYLIGFSDDDNEIRTYRVDKIRELKVVYEMYVDSKIDIIKYIDETDEMFHGRKEHIELLCERESMDYIVDKFGNDFVYKGIIDGKIKIEADQVLCPPFYSWLFMFSSKFELIGSDKAKKMYNDFYKEGAKKK